MTDKQIQDRAYLIATGNHLTEDFNYKQFQNVDIRKHLWQLTEDWPIKELESHIAGIADQITNLVKEARDQERIKN